MSIFKWSRLTLSVEFPRFRQVQYQLCPDLPGRIDECLREYASGEY